jgi:putative transposase
MEISNSDQMAANIRLFSCFCQSARYKFRPVLGTDGLQLKYQGGQPFLTGEQRQAVITWLKAQQIWSVELLRSYIQTSYAVVYKSKQSYYEMLAEAGITYKRAQARNPKHDAEQVAAKKKPSRSF